MAKTVVITGSSRGIGAQTAREFAAAGYNVVINYLNSEEKARVLAEEIGGIAVKADVSKEKEAKLLIDEALRCFGTLDVLVNNAAIAQQKLFTDITGEEWDRMFEVNVKGAFNCTKAALKYMIKEHRGKIINISSMWGVTGGSCEVHYSASKAALIGMTKALAKEVGPSGIQVNCVAPGVIMTEMNSNLDEEAINEIKQETPLGVIGLPSDVAKTILFL
ncbi:MAG: SDR family oxidoreductase, partial [Bacillota bacterium]|nr:SDR family oxidoreductase [Bacillota bacterium]